MKQRKLLVFIILIFFISLLYSKDKWLESVKPIITKAEIKVYKSLKTEEEKRKFIEYFWKARDPNPETIVNEYKEEYFKRVRYAKDRLGGINSDRGRIYIYLGKPLEVKRYRGYEKIVSCELWIYKNDDPKTGLPPFMNILFYKPSDMGDYKLFYPGVQSTFDLLTPSFINHAKSRQEAFRLVKMDFPELAQASLSVIPMEGSPLYNIPNSSSGRVIAKIFSIPEEKVNKSYLSIFAPQSGIVEVEYSFKEIFGKFHFSKNEKAGFDFISYSIIPDHIGFKRMDENSYFAKLQIIVRVESLKGKLLLEKTNKINLKVNSKRKQDIDEKGIIFSGFVPIIPKEKIKVKVLFYNETSKEYLSKEGVVNQGEPIFCLGFKYVFKRKGLSPYQFEDLKIVADPRMIFSKEDELIGIVKSRNKPFVTLINKDNKKNFNLSVERLGNNYYMFKTPLKSFQWGGYYVKVLSGKAEFSSKDFAVIPYVNKKPLIFEKDDKDFNLFKYMFFLGEEYLNNKEVKKAISILEKIPPEFRTEGMSAVYGKAYYLSGNYKKVIELFEKKGKKDYPSLALLANSYLKLNHLKKAALFFEKLRKYGDTVDINNKLGAIYYSLGERDKARIYWNRAKKIKEKKEVK